MQKTHSIVVNIADPTADARFPILQVPEGSAISVVSASAVCDTALANGDTNVVALTLQDGGADATGTTTVGAELTNTVASGGAWVAATPREFTIADNLLQAGDWLVLKYDETGTVAPKNQTVQVDYVIGHR